MRKRLICSCTRGRHSGVVYRFAGRLSSTSVLPRPILLLGMVQFSFTRTYTCTKRNLHTFLYTSLLVGRRIGSPPTPLPTVPNFLILPVFCCDCIYVGILSVKDCCVANVSRRTVRLTTKELFHSKMFVCFCIFFIGKL